MPDLDLLKWVFSQGVAVALLLFLMWWLTQKIGPQLVQTMEKRLRDGFSDTHKRIDLLYKNDRIRMKVGYMRELREQGVPPEQARLLAIELVGNGDHHDDDGG